MYAFRSALNDMYGVGLETKQQLEKKLVGRTLEDGSVCFSVAKQLANPYLKYTRNR